ncbi:MAG: hypothetical protein R2764_08105 [Bacteroidales bacterium]
MRLKKSDKADLENKRGIFLQIGTIISLSIIFLAFEWTTVKQHKIDWERYGSKNLMEEMAEVTIHRKELPEMPKPQIIQKIEFVDNKTDIETEIEISVEITEETKNDLDQIFEEKEIEIERASHFYGCGKAT